ncbi:hypothetical protein P168DRAFT_320904 [Aspergillus campestris IBT 28561]|uniref:Uncharacterized protein n=1 Tax=Aspergillus campestris (strain IBT 28561) TaxID=1392248 RepID=A0A2I1CXL8_ASPC2|nr:uncharacterized protein P168DRAFT_320904 [Aspergillus campestris IBT 28561]PKY02364.1 hypothetical protein P168DRAFT_320904 [Aspergillus campestris IBT 28561]
MKLTRFLSLLAILQPVLGAPYGCAKKLCSLESRSSRPDTPVALGLVERDGDDDEASCTHTCGPLVRLPGQSDPAKRDLGTIQVHGTPASSDENLLEARTLNIPPDNRLAGYINGQISRKTFDLIVWNRHIPTGDEDEEPEMEGMGTSRAREFKDKAFSMGTDGLTGCTVMTLVSRSGVFMGHWFEDISFTPTTWTTNDDGTKSPGWLKQYKTRDKAFEQTVVNGLREGVKQGEDTTEPGKPEQVPVSDVKGALEDGHAKGYLMVPLDACPGMGATGYEKYYVKRWEAMRGVVAGVVPAFADEGLWKEHKYRRDDPEDPRRAVDGSVLLQYDPDDRYDAGGKTMTRKRVVMWMGTEKVRDDEWDNKEVPEGQ